ncbi:MAG: glycosyltransferase family 4 protein, partial [Longimicrobiales bacterium]
MKVLYIVTAFPRSDDDLITPWLVETIHRLQAVGIDVEVLAPSYRGLDDQTVTDIRVHRFRYGPARWEDLTHDQTAPDRLRARPLYAALLPSYLTAGTAAAVRLARSGRFSLLHVHWPLPHAAFGLAARAASGLPLVLTFHGVELTWARRQLPFLHPLLRRAIRSADAVTANSSYTEAMIRALHERPVIRIPFGATIAPPRPGPSGP